MTFAAPIATRMACPPTLDALERRLQDVIALTSRYQHKSTELRLIDDSGQILAELTAVYFR